MSVSRHSSYTEGSSLEQYLIYECIKRRLNDAGFYWNPVVVSHYQGTHIKNYLQALHHLCREYEDAFRRSYSEIQNYEVRVDSPQAQSQFNESMDSLFSDGNYSYGRIIGMIVFGSMLALQAMTLNKPELVTNVARWLYDYMQRQEIKSFMVANGGWDGVLELNKLNKGFITDLQQQMKSPASLAVISAVVVIAGAVVFTVVINK